MRVRMFLTGLLAWTCFSTGCLSIPQSDGACFYRTSSGDDACWESTASQCEEVGGRFTDGDTCAVWDLLHPPT